LKSDIAILLIVFVFGFLFGLEKVAQGYAQRFGNSGQSIHRNIFDASFHVAYEDRAQTGFFRQFFLA